MGSVILSGSSWIVRGWCKFGATIGLVHCYNILKVKFMVRNKFGNNIKPLPAAKVIHTIHRRLIRESKHLFFERSVWWFFDAQLRAFINNFVIHVWCSLRLIKGANYEIFLSLREGASVTVMGRSRLCAPGGRKSATQSLRLHFPANRDLLRNAKT